MIYRGIVTENSAATLMARITKEDGTYPTQSDISSIAIKSYDEDTGALIKSGTATVSAAITNTPTVDSRWTADTTGANVFLALDGGYWLDGDSTVRVEAHIVPVAGNAIYVVWSLQVDSVFSE